MADLRVTLLTSRLAIVEAERNLEAKRPAALPTLRRGLAGVRIVGEPAPANVERLPLRVMTPRQFLTEVHP